MKYKAVIFDMDGLLIDSELHWWRAEMEFLKKYGINFTPEHANRMSGRSLRESVSILKDEHSLPHAIEELLGEKNKVSEAIYTFKAKPMTGAEEILAAARASGLKMAIASGSSLDRIEQIVERFGWQKYFDDLVSTDHVEYVGKPDPRIYTCAANRLDVPVETCVVIENSLNGLKAAKAAGMACVAVPDEWVSKDVFVDADLVVDSLANPSIYSFLGFSL